jgi:hypothetical protein
MAYDCTSGVPNSIINCGLPKTGKQCGQQLLETLRSGVGKLVTLISMSFQQRRGLPYACSTYTVRSKSFRTDFFKKIEDMKRSHAFF